MELQYNSEKLSQSFFKMISHLKSFRDIEPVNVSFYFTIYKNGNPANGESLHRKKIIKIFENKEENIYLPIQISYLECELGVNSLLLINKKKRHFPLIDFSYPRWDEDFENALLELKKKYPGDIYIFDSGRSFHGYHDIILSESNWKKYLGELLLLNKKNLRDDIVDTRWVGHCLKQGYSCLRISHNTKAYLKLPEFRKKV